MAAIDKAGYVAGKDVVLAIDMAAGQLYKDGLYHFTKEKKHMSVDELNIWYDNLLQSYPIRSIEDPFDQEAWNDWTAFTKKHPTLQTVADDLVATNERRLHRAMREHAANTLLIKPSHIGTLTETIHAARLAQETGWKTIIAQRGAETEDVTIAHLAVGLKAGQIKAGSVARGERTAKYNELLRISESLKSDLLAPMWR
jgi:enolase